MKARSLTSRDTVKPTPPTMPTPARSRQPNSSLSSARVNRVISHDPPRTPIGLPSTSPSTTPSTIGSVSKETPPVSGTPALNSANSGTATPALIGEIRCSRRSVGERASPSSGKTRVSRPSTTPAMVACTPLS